MSSSAKVLNYITEDGGGVGGEACRPQTEEGKGRGWGGGGGGCYAVVGLFPMGGGYTIGHTLT